MEVDLEVTEEMKETLKSLTLDQLFTRVTGFMKKTGAVEAEFSVGGDHYECVLHFKELKESN